MKALTKPLGAGLVAVTCLIGPSWAHAANSEPLRICAAADELPFSKQGGDGFENEIAKIVMINEPRPGDSDVHAAGFGGGRARVGAAVRGGAAECGGGRCAGA